MTLFSTNAFCINNNFKITTILFPYTSLTIYPLASSRRNGFINLFQEYLQLALLQRTRMELELVSPISHS